MTSFTATYSPDDNKLRISASSRLDKETYTRVRAAGFIWAPKQEIFVAPMWTPERAALCEELAGEIGDEDTSLADRAEARADRFEDYSEKRAKDADAAAAAVKRLADGIPLGQPILIGHHSERHARKDAERIDNGMRRAVNAWKTSEYWTRRAAASLAHAERKERPDVRARRIKKIEADLRRVQKTMKRAELLAAAWVNPWDRLKNKDGERPSPRAAVVFLGNRDGGYFATNHARPSGYVGPISFWEAAGGNIDGADPETRAIATPEEICARAIEYHRATIARCQPWVDHYQFRLEYERAMLAEGGGLATDRTGPEKGGAIKTLWAPRGGWAIIHKVNRVSVTVRHTYNDGPEARVFPRNIPMDKVREIMTRAEVEAARAEGRLVPVGDYAFYLAAPRPPEAPEAPEAPSPAPVEPATPAADFEAMAAALKAGGAKVITAPQLFPTPKALADRMAEAAGLEDGMRVLEPSAGTGALLRAALRACDGALEMTAVEINTDLAMQLSAEGLASTVEAGRDFLQCNGDLGKFDRVIMNPPFSGAADIRHILHARQFLKPGGRIVALCANGPRQGEALRELAERSGGYFEPLPAGSFAEQGTGVNVALVVIEHENG